MCQAECEKHVSAVVFHGFVQKALPGFGTDQKFAQCSCLQQAVWDRNLEVCNLKVPPGVLGGVEKSDQKLHAVQQVDDFLPRDSNDDFELQNVVRVQRFWHVVF